MRGRLQALAGRAEAPALQARNFEVQRLDPGLLEFELALQTLQQIAKRLYRICARRIDRVGVRPFKHGLAAVSHEIRTPMNGLFGLLELLDLSGLNPEQRVTLTAAREAGDALLLIIDDILDFSKIEASRIELHPGAIQ